MFDLYGIYDTSEIMIIVLVIIIIILIIVIVILYFSPIKKEIVKIEKDIEEEIDEIIEPEKPKKINKDIKNKDVNKQNIQYSPSEYATLLKYNPILPYSAFTMDIINNAYLDFNEKSNYDDRYFSLANYDNIYKSYNEPLDTSMDSGDPDDQDNQSGESDRDKISKLSKKVENYRRKAKRAKSSDSESSESTSKTDSYSSLDSMYNSKSNPNPDINN
jgi:hypothetical protein